MGIQAKVGIPVDVKHSLESLRSWCGMEYGVTTLCKQLTEVYYDLFHTRACGVLDGIFLGIASNYLASLDSEEYIASDAIDDISDYDLREIIDVMPQNHPLYDQLVDRDTEQAKEIILATMVESLPSIFAFRQILQCVPDELGGLLDSNEYDALDYIALNFNHFVVRFI